MVLSESVQEAGGSADGDGEEVRQIGPYLEQELPGLDEEKVCECSYVASLLRSLLTRSGGQRKDRAEQIIQFPTIDVEAR